MSRHRTSEPEKGRSTQPSALAYHSVEASYAERLVEKLAVGIAADSQSVKTTEKRGMSTALMVAS
ncbi:hypothetical protein [Nostoc sp. UHCC 0251]|uniref:hypothetical protein n=1 Tax=Nostoc sp. UHCC 0251 TaxID=3110240 RepID=UPI002B1F18A8|nr:hypothetical protein [Nostoc sp. UHCC 0251]MEA5627166.1 hypothetical protein [Nostoc sp. UHCC 0251]